MTKFIGFHQHFMKEIEEEIKADSAWVSRGKAKTLEEYKQMCGKIEGMQKLLDRYKDLIANMENVDD